MSTHLPPAAALEDGSFLAEASRRLADAVDYEQTLTTVAALALPRLGDCSIVDLAEPDGSMRRLAVVHPDPQKVLRRFGCSLSLARSLAPIPSTSDCSLALALSIENFLERPPPSPRRCSRPGLSQPIDQGVTWRVWPLCTSSAATDG
jgi:hypothetical protein